MDKTFLITKPGHGWVLVNREYIELLVGKASTAWAEDRLGEEGVGEVKVHTFAIKRGPGGWDEKKSE